MEFIGAAEPPRIETKYRDSLVTLVAARQLVLDQIQETCLPRPPRARQAKDEWLRAGHLLQRVG